MNIIYLDDYHCCNETIMPQAPVIVKAGVDSVTDFQRARKRWPKASIIGYEADPKNHARWVAAAKAVGVRLHNKAVGERGEVVLYRYTNSVSNSTFPRHTYDKNCKYVDQVTVQSLNMEDVLADAGGHIDLLVLNCEGGELPIVAAMRDSSVREKVAQICVSFHDPRIYPTAKKQAIIRDLAQYYWMFRGDKCPRGGMADYLWIRKVGG